MATNLQDQYVFVYHSDRENYATSLKEKLEAEIKCKKIFVSDVFCGCGTNIGPGMISVYFMGEPVTSDLQVEKEALTLAIEGK